MSRRAVLRAGALGAFALVVHVARLPAAVPARVDAQLREMPDGAGWVELVVRAGLVLELWAELAVAGALMLTVHEAGHALAVRFAPGRALVVRAGGPAATLLCATLAALALALGGFDAVAGRLVSVFPDPLLALVLAGVGVAGAKLWRGWDTGASAGARPPTMHPALVRSVLGKALDDGDTARALPLAEQLLEVVDRPQDLALTAPLLLRCAAAEDFPPALAGRIAVRLGHVELRSVLHRGPDPRPGLPRPDDAPPASPQERLDGVARLMQLGARLTPGDVDARLGLAWTRSAQHRDDEAQKLARAVRLKLDEAPREPGDVRADLADVLRAVSAARLGAAEQAERLLARVARNHPRTQNGGRLPEELAAALDYARREPAALS